MKLCTHPSKEIFLRAQVHMSIGPPQQPTRQDTQDNSENNSSPGTRPQCDRPCCEAGSGNSAMRAVIWAKPCKHCRAQVCNGHDSCKWQYFCKTNQGCDVETEKARAATKTSPRAKRTAHLQVVMSLSPDPTGRPSCKLSQNIYLAFDPRHDICTGRRYSNTMKKGMFGLPVPEPTRAV